MNIDATFAWIEKNPHKQHHLPRSAMNTNDDALLEPVVWDQFRKVRLDVPGCLSCCFMQTDPLYRSSTVNSQKHILRDAIMELEERIHKELVGRKWSRRKLVEQVSAQLAEKAPTMEVALEEALCELFGVQKLMINHREKTISFFPTDPRVWKSGVPLIVSDSDNVWLYEPVDGALDMGSRMVQWLEGKEDQGWRIGWPVADGRFEELKAALEAKGLSARAKVPGEKVKKEDYARTLGRAEALSALLKLSNTRDEI